MTLEDGELVVGAHRGEGFRISPAVRDRVLNEHTSVLVRDTALDNAFRDRRSITDAKVRTLMAVPLQTGEEIIGLIYVDSPAVICRFTKEDLSLLTVMANIAAIRIEHNRWEVIEADLTFHRALVAATDNARLIRVHRELGAEMRLCLAQLVKGYATPKELSVEHARLLEPIERGRPQAAERAIREHFFTALDWLIEHAVP